MRIAQIVPSLEERHGGPSKSVYDLSAAIAAAGHEVELLATGEESQEIPGQESFSTRIFKRGWPDFLCPSAGLRRHLSESDAEIVHHHALWLRTLHYAHRSAARKGARFVVSPRGMMSRWAMHHRHGRKRLAGWFVHPGALAAAHGWHATSDEEAADIRALGFRQPVCVAPNGVAAPSSEKATEAARYWSELCPDVGSRPVALFYSRFHRKKRVVELIDAWLENGPRDWLLLMVGIPEEYTVEMIEDYILRASGSGRVRVFSGIDRPPPYSVASLFLLASHNENFGLAIAEALAHGVPALVTDSTPWRVLNENGGGWCLPWEKFPGAIRAATAEGPERLRTRGTIARNWVLREYSWEKPARSLAAFYATLQAT